MEVDKARVYRGGTGWTWYHRGCDAADQDGQRGTRAVGMWWWGDIRPTMVDAFKRAQKHMEREHGLGIRMHSDHH